MTVEIFLLNLLEKNEQSLGSKTLKHSIYVFMFYKKRKTLRHNFGNKKAKEIKKNKNLKNFLACKQKMEKDSLLFLT